MNRLIYVYTLVLTCALATPHPNGADNWGLLGEGHDFSLGDLCAKEEHLLRFKSFKIDVPRDVLQLAGDSAP